MALLATNHAPFVNIHPPAIRAVRLAPPDQFHVNLNNFTNVTPFIPFDWNRPKQPISVRAQPNLGINLSLYPPRTVIPYDMTAYRLLKPRAPDQIYPNLVISFGRPFTPIDYSRPHAVMLAPIPVVVGFQIAHSPPVASDRHDGVFVKKRRKRPDLIKLELEEKAARRAAIELAIYGPEVEYKEPPTVFAAPAPAPPDVGDLAKVVAMAQAAQFQGQRSRDEHDEEDDLESILQEIL
jgi:hypothetical protein